MTETPLRVRIKIWLWRQEAYARVATAIHVLLGYGVVRGITVVGRINMPPTDKQIRITGNTFIN